MITANAAMALSIARGLIKLSGRTDRLLAEKEAVTSELILKMPSFDAGPSTIVMVRELRKYLEDTKNDSPDPLGKIRQGIENELGQETPDSTKITQWFTFLFPEKAMFPVLDPDSEYIKNLKENYPELNLSDKDTLAAAFYIGPGKDQRQIGYGWRMALLVVDVMAEFGAENTALFTRDEVLRSIIQAVLVRFSKPDLESYDSWSPFLRHALTVTLNGVLDARQAYQSDDPWLNAILNALARAREKAKDGDNYVLGLMQGKGYHALISEGLSVAATTLDSACAGGFEKVVAHILKEAAPLVSKSRDFHDFFQDHWGNLVRAGLTSLEKYGPDMLKDESPALRDTLLAIVKELSRTTDAQFLSPDVLLKITDAALGAVSIYPDLVLHDVEQEWLKKLFRSALETIGNQSIRSTFSKKGLEIIISNVAGTMAENPELIIKEPGLFQSLAGGILKAVKDLNNFDAHSIATAATTASLDVLARNPSLLGTRYPYFVADCAERLAELVASKKIQRIQAADIITVASQAVVLNPILFNQTQERLVGEVVRIVVEAAQKDDKKMIAGAALVEVVRYMLDAVASHGAALIDSGFFAQFLDKAAKILDAGLVLGGERLGRNLSLPSLPIMLSGLIAAQLKGDIAAVDLKDPQFVEVFDGLIERLTA
ncbi:MAG: hypothetical protein A4E65_00027 [Syntrophorhabdus sp. PtaU1.Bin153]|nr:MAG: hypothetical protein A4E65_00027 [Syntrophorhabdus sp. PtaU1.Bin153]